MQGVSINAGVTEESVRNVGFIERTALYHRAVYLGHGDSSARALATMSSQSSLLRPRGSQSHSTFRSEQFSFHP